MIPAEQLRTADHTPGHTLSPSTPIPGDAGQRHAPVGGGRTIHSQYRDIERRARETPARTTSDLT